MEEGVLETYPQNVGVPGPLLLSATRYIGSPSLPMNSSPGSLGHTAHVGPWAATAATRVASAKMREMVSMAKKWGLATVSGSVMGSESGLYSVRVRGFIALMECAVLISVRGCPEGTRS